jgi:AcrR family transcriptional regulator
MYRHWASKRALYLDVLRAVWVGAATDVVRALESGPPVPSVVVGAYLDAMLKDPMGAQILIREYLDGAPYLAQLAQSDPGILEPVRRAAAALAASAGDGVDPILSAVTIGGLAALVASAREATKPFVDARIAPETWRRQAFDLLVYGVAAARPPAPAPAHAPTNGSAANGPM